MKRFNYLPLILLLLAVTLFFKPYVFQGKLPIPADTIIGLYHPFRDFYANDYPNGIPYKNFLITDPVRQQYPWRYLAIDSIKQGSIPLWNPYEMAGTPLLANFQSAAFYPLNLLFFLFPFATAWSLLIFLQPALGGVFMYLYLHNLRLHRFASFLGAIVFSFSGFMVAWMEWGALGHTVIWLPLILLTIDKLFISTTTYSKSWWGWNAVFVLSFSAALFAGHLQTYLYVLLLSVMYFFARWVQHGKSLKVFLHFMLLVLGFLLITAVQWIPTVQFISLSARSVDQLLGWQQPGWFIPWQHLIQFVAPDFFGNPTTLNYWGEWNYGEFIGYVGMVPLVMAVFALYGRHDKKTCFFGVSLLLGLLFSLPTFVAKLPYILEIPFLSTTQPTRLLLVVDFSLAVLAALGFDYFVKSRRKFTIIYSLGLLGAVLLGLWGAVLLNIQITPSFTPENIAIAKRNLYIPTFFFIITVLLLAVLAVITTLKRFHTVLNVKVLSTLLMVFLLSLTLFDLLRFFEKFTPFSDAKYLFPSTKALAYLQKQEGQFRIMTTDSRILPPNFSVMYRLQSLDGYDPLYPRQYGELMVALKRGKPDISPPFGFNRIITPQAYESRLVDLLGVRYILSLTDIDSPKLQKVFTEGQTKIYQNTQAYPRTFFVENITTVSDNHEAITKLFDRNVNLQKTAIVELADKSFEKVPIASGAAEIISYKENRVEIKTKNKAVGYLVFMDSYYPSWQAKICAEQEKDCTNFEIFVTNYNFRGIFVPAGEHSVIFYNSLL